MAAAGANGAPRHPGVRFPPPALYVAGFLLGWLLQRRRPLPLAPASLRDEREIAGMVLLALGIGTLAWGLATLLRARTSVMPHRPASRLVSGGPYRFTRNPMYLGMTLVYLGLALVLDWLWPVVLLPVVLASLTVLVIRREERYLAHAFGEEYERYRGHVRRWL